MQKMMHEIPFYLEFWCIKLKFKLWIMYHKWLIEYCKHLYQIWNFVKGWWTYEKTTWNYVSIDFETFSKYFAVLDILFILVKFFISNLFLYYNQAIRDIARRSMFLFFCKWNCLLNNSFRYKSIQDAQEVVGTNFKLIKQCIW